MANKIDASKGAVGLSSKQEAEELIAAYKEQNPVKYRIKKENGQFEKLLGRFKSGGEFDQAVQMQADVEQKKANELEEEKESKKGDTAHDEEAVEQKKVAKEAKEENKVVEVERVKKEAAKDKRAAKSKA